MSIWLIEPRDPLVARDGRPMTVGGALRTLGFPFPSAVAGAVRTRLAGGAGNFSLSPAEIGELLGIEVAGPLLGELADGPEGCETGACGEPAKPAGENPGERVRGWFVPAPADALLGGGTGGNGAWSLRPLLPRPRRAGEQLDPLGDLLLVEPCDTPAAVEQPAAGAAGLKPVPEAPAGTPPSLTGVRPDRGEPPTTQPARDAPAGAASLEPTPGAPAGTPPPLAGTRSDSGAPATLRSTLDAPAGFTTSPDAPAGVQVPPGVPADVKPPLDAPAFWSWEIFESWLVAPAAREVGRADLGLPALLQESRSHVAIQPGERVGIDGMLFTTVGLRFLAKGDGGHSSSPTLAARRFALGVRCGGGVVGGRQLSLAPALAPLGGERRLARWRPAETRWPALPVEIRRRVRDSGRARLVLLTPAVFSAGSLPGWSGEIWSSDLAVRVTVRAACAGRPVVVSGWDLAADNGGDRPRGRPKPTRRLVPAGSVYFVALAGGPAERERWCETVWLQSICDAPQDRRDGFGLAAVGSWEPCDERD